MRTVLLILALWLCTLVSYDVVANTNEQWKKLDQFLDGYCYDKSCLNNPSKTQFLAILTSHKYGCIAIPQPLTTRLDSNDFASFLKYEGFLVSYLDSPRNYQNTLSQTERVLSKLNKLGLSKIHLGEPSPSTTDFTAPFKPLCGNNAVVFDPWRGFITPMPYGNEPNSRPPVLLVFTGRTI